MELRAFLVLLEVVVWNKKKFGGKMEQLIPSLDKNGSLQKN